MTLVSRNGPAKFKSHPRRRAEGRGVLRAATNAAVDAELLDRSPCRRIRVPSSAPTFAYALKPGEVARLAYETGPRYETMIFRSDARAAFCESAALRIGRLDVEQGTISIQERSRADAGGVRPDDNRAGPRRRRNDRRVLRVGDRTGALPPLTLASTPRSPAPTPNSLAGNRHWCIASAGDAELLRRGRGRSLRREHHC